MDDDSHWIRDRNIDRRIEAEPSYRRQRIPRIPLNERGALRMHFEKPQPVVPAEKPWRPSDGGES